MKANLNLGSISGIKIIIHWTFFLLIIWIVIQEINQGGSTEAVLFNVALILSVFVCVVLHELGHALTAKHYGVQTKKITLLPIGGMASLDKIPEVPKQEFLITIAGPLVNVVIALLLYFLIPVSYFTDQNITELLYSLKKFSLQSFLFYLFIVNVGLVLFNLIPAFPMDGGRILRSLLAMKFNRVKATQIAAGIGQFIAVFFLLIGLLYNPFLVFIALFIFIGAYGENQMVHHLAILKGHKVKDAMLTQITKFNPEDSIQDVIKILIAGTENDFVVVENEEVKGIVYHDEIIKNSQDKSLLIKDIMNSSFKLIDINTDLKKVYELTHSEKNNFFAVVDNNKLVGAIDLNNLNEYILLQAKLEY